RKSRAEPAHAGDPTGTRVGARSPRSDAATAVWWTAYWARLPRLSLPNARLAALLRHGLYKLAGLTHPRGVPATLQGPWVEDTRRPPWNGDYHFNVNVQLAYAPALPAGLPDHLEPLLRMIDGWAPLLRDNAHAFVGIDDGVLLQHATDDRGETSLLFWTGAIDHACTAWVGLMMYQHWQYTGDDARLRERTRPFLRGALRVFEEMLVPGPDGRLALPVGVSPEYRGAAPDAWGRDATFQLVACHWLVEALTEIAAHLGEPPEPRWADITARLPRHSLHGEPGKEQIALWSGLPVGESHRHHSHLGGLWPFGTLDYAVPSERALIRRTLDTWTTLGMGKWAGWSLPWAAMIHARTDNGVMTEAVLELWERVFTNEGRASLHDPVAPGFTRIGRKWEPGAGDEIMQMEAGMGAVAAIYDALVHVRRGVLHVFAGVPDAWRDVSFEDIHTEAGVRVSARREAGIVTRVRLVAVRATTVRLASPWADDPRGPVLTTVLAAGQTVEFGSPAPPS
ncbi:MAG: hypothetical protein H7Y06_00005, partial [Opitutaceae bacterium]|nr:hypothetical protein [Opitutaceae bacterium]